MTRPLSLVVITRNEEKDLPGCLKSAADLAAEIIVVDNNSQDRTVEIARSFGAKVISRVFDDYTSQKNFALSHASQEWVLHLDADERLTHELRNEIAELFRKGWPKANGYEIPYSVVFMGRTLRHAGTGTERHLRLLRKSMARFSGGAVHEKLVVTGETQRLSGRIIHIPYTDMGEYLKKLDIYTLLAARKAFGAGRKYHPLKLLILPLEFLKRYLLRLGFLDGVPGFIWCTLASFYVWLKVVRLREITR
ncbi:MAG: glycosyltransferase family 2 protein [bacterium]